MNRTLDLSDTRSWMKVAKTVASKVVSPQIREALKDFDPEDMYDDTLPYLVEISERFGEMIDLQEWEDNFSEQFSFHYDSIRAFHACRPLDLDSYKRRGILKLTKELLLELAVEVLGGHASKEKISRAIDELDISWDEFGVNLFTDSKSPLDSSQNHYLWCGSEELQGLAIKLNLGSRGILNGRGRPHLIECVVPLENVRSDFYRNLWRLLITQYFKKAAGGRPLTQAPDFCIRVTEDIHPEMIKRFIPLSDENLVFEHCWH